jgi:hypothetical protein
VQAKAASPRHRLLTIILVHALVVSPLALPLALERVPLRVLGHTPAEPPAANSAVLALLAVLPGLAGVALDVDLRVARRLALSLGLGLALPLGLGLTLAGAAEVLVDVDPGLRRSVWVRQVLRHLQIAQR